MPADLQYLLESIQNALIVFFIGLFPILGISIYASQRIMEDPDMNRRERRQSRKDMLSLVTGAWAAICAFFWWALH